MKLYSMVNGRCMVFNPNDEDVISEFHYSMSRSDGVASLHEKHGYSMVSESFLRLMCNLIIHNEVKLYLIQDGRNLESEDTINRCIETCDNFIDGMLFHDSSMSPRKIYLSILMAVLKKKFDASNDIIKSALFIDSNFKSISYRGKYYYKLSIFNQDRKYILRRENGSLAQFRKDTQKHSSIQDYNEEEASIFKAYFVRNILHNDFNPFGKTGLVTL